MLLLFCGKPFGHFSGDCSPNITGDAENLYGLVRRNARCADEADHIIGSAGYATVLIAFVKHISN